MISIIKKSLFISLFTSCAFSLNAQVGLKGIVLGEKSESTQELSTTLVGQPYIINALHLKDKTIYGIDAIPAENRRVDQDEIDLLIEAFNNKFGIEFQFVSKHKKNIKLGEYVGSSKHVNFKIEIIANEKVLAKPYRIIISLRNISLEEKAIQEAKAKVINDL